MKIVRCETKAQLKTVLEKSLFRPHYETSGEVEDVDLSPEQVCEMLGINPESLLEDRGDNLDPDLFDDNLSMNEVIQHVLYAESIPMLKDFKPGVLVYHFEDSFDRMGSTEHHTFHFVEDTDITFDAWQVWYADIQNAYSKQNELRASKYNHKDGE